MIGSHRRASRASRGRLAGSDTAGLVGWIFADMLMGLVIIAMAAQGSRSAAAGRHDVSSVAAPSASAQGPKGRMDQTPIAFTLKVDSQGMRDGDSAALSRFRSRLYGKVADLEAQGRSAAMVLVFGSAPHVPDGMQVASKAVGQLEQTSPAIFGGSALRTFWTDGPDNRLKIEIYLFGRE